MTKASFVPASSSITPTLIHCLEQGEIAILPMATLYCFVVHGQRPQAIHALRHLKQFDQEQPLGILSRGDRVHEVARPTPAAQRLMQHFPYPVTLLLPAQTHLDPAITLGFSQVFISCPDAFIYDLVGGVPFPLVAATVRFSGEAIVTGEAARRYFSDRVSLIVDGGRSKYGRSGTLIDFTLPAPTIMNFGPVSVDDLRPILPEVVLPSHLMK